MYIFEKFKNKKVLITGHTGFKGAWLSLWMYLIGARVVGVSLPNKNKNNHFNKLNLKKNFKSYYFDIQNINDLKKIFVKHKPDYVFHLAGQSLVKKSYKSPRNTFLTNTIGTLNILESLLLLKKECVAVIITSDKVYYNRETSRGYLETDELGGKDPYSSSKACAEKIIFSYLNSFLRRKKNLKIAIARAGNVIGGGDWNESRLIPDCIKAWSKKEKVLIRNPSSTRPWQNVLDVLKGYMTLAIKLKKNSKLNGEAFNFGPRGNDNYSVLQIIKYLKSIWKMVDWKVHKSKKSFYESKLLKLNSNKAAKLLNWKCSLTTKESLHLTIDWYKRNLKSKKNTFFLSKSILDKYLNIIKKN